MAEPGEQSGHEAGVYEKLITESLQSQIEGLEAIGWKAVHGEVGKESTPHVLARYIGEAVGRRLSQLAPKDQVAAANHILRSLSATAPDPEEDATLGPIVDGPRQLLALAEQEAPGVYAIRPLTPLSETALITNATGDPNLGAELRAEIATADHIDLLCAFVKWHGIRVLEDALRAARKRDVPIRIITTTYMGATDRYALDRLAREFGAHVKVNYEIRSTRLHAKAWLFRRNTGYNTAYVGSSNLSKAALLDGLEWNVRLSSVATPRVVDKFEATFDAYWNDVAFETYDPDHDGDRLAAALAHAGGKGTSEDLQINISGLEVRPFPHQQDMLERLHVERELRGHHQNLLVAATGTGKTVMAALDYRKLRDHRSGELPRLLFVAHRKEILRQSLRTYREVLADGNFGELFYNGEEPREWSHVFASVQSLNLQRLERLDPAHFDVVVIDEFHHATASTYRRILNHFKPVELLGLTATPERMDGQNVQDAYFGGRIAAELRLWEALENDLLCPFHYFGTPDGTDLSQISWRAGNYDRDELENLYTASHAHALIVIKQVKDKIPNLAGMRALGFCVSKKHAHFMAERFRDAGFRAAALDSDSSPTERERTLRDLRDGNIQVIFSVDLFNEGLDIPEVDTLILLRPTNSATVFLQQLGRGLRRTANKPVLTVLDFIGQHRAEFRFEEQFRALTNLSRNRLVESIERDFPQLPSGCQIILEGKSKELILNNIRTQLNTSINTLAKEVRDYSTPQLAAYLRESRRDIKELYRNKNSWTSVLRRAGIIEEAPTAGEEELLKRIHAFLHVDDQARAQAYLRLLADDAPDYDSLSPGEQVYARMLFFNLWDKAGGYTSYGEGLASLRSQHLVRDELRQVLTYVLDRTDHYPVALDGPLSHLPLKIHSSYNRSEILAALGVARLGGQMPRDFGQGVRWVEELKTDALLITLEKDERDFSPSVRYKDYAISRKRFHWESQSTISANSPTGLRYQRHVEQRSHVLLFLRRYKNNSIGKSEPWMLLGPATYQGHTGSKPMAITWELQHELPADVWSYAAAVASG
ncbi:DUF3427 domain-containing protein [Streptomyces griseosporeus]|uniref:DUF3427 domain-containing protein n=1 Tax=Streptomyces griseosporeus TaxID=1910 RepID=UPI0019AFA485|nr:DEAD/DEAH box helicase [Streptomyces griseosporeus]GHF66968.1 helicase [Streptomyces griseosporeus]